MNLLTRSSIVLRPVFGEIAINATYSAGMIFYCWRHYGKEEWLLPGVFWGLAVLGSLAMTVALAVAKAKLDKSDDLRAMQNDQVTFVVVWLLDLAKGHNDLGHATERDGILDQVVRFWRYDLGWASQVEQRLVADPELIRHIVKLPNFKGMDPRGESIKTEFMKHLGKCL